VLSIASENPQSLIHHTELIDVVKCSTHLVAHYWSLEKLYDSYGIVDNGPHDMALRSLQVDAGGVTLELSARVIATHVTCMFLDPAGAPQHASLLTHS
jgi:hypothetical protein